MRRILLGALVLIAMLGGYLLFWPAPIAPAVFIPAENPGLTGAFAPNQSLRPVKHLAEGIGQAPEDVTKGPDGFLYTGLLDGRIVRCREDGAGAETFVNTGGRPLGMQFDSQGNLIVADASRGLLSVGPDRRITVLADYAGSEPLKLVNDLDIAADGTIWFSDSSRRFPVEHFILDFLETRPTGRLLSYNPRNGATETRLDGLMFANGVALGPDDSFVLVAESFGARITRLWLSGANAGKRDTFLVLPGYPDNLSYNHRGIFWIALARPRLAALERLWRGTFLRTVLSRLPERLLRGDWMRQFSWVVGVDVRGKVVYNLQDSRGECGSLASVNEFDGNLYLGSIRMSSIGRFRLPGRSGAPGNATVSVFSDRSRLLRSRFAGGAE